LSDLCEAELEVFILDCVQRSRKKVAFVIGKAMVELNATDSVVANKIAKMCDNNKLIAFGNIANWRFSEIGLPYH